MRKPNFSRTLNSITLRIKISTVHCRKELPLNKRKQGYGHYVWIPTLYLNQLFVGKNGGYLIHINSYLTVHS